MEEKEDTQSIGVAPENEDDEIPAPESPEEESNSDNDEKSSDEEE